LRSAVWLRALGFWYSGDVEVALITLTVLALAGLIVQQLFFWRFFRRFSAVLRGVRGDSLEGLLIEHLKRLSSSMEEIEKTKQAYQYLEAMTTRSVQKVGLVRFNPFKDTGSDQSFSVALLDLYDNGVVLSGIHGREGTRVYAKSVHGGESGGHLSDEELRAIDDARSAGERQQSLAKGAA
jgi:hypothetical protein